MDKKYEPPIISLRKAALLLNVITEEDAEGSECYVFCPLCSPQHNSSRRTLNLNFENNTYRCARCGTFAGGVYKFVSHYTGWPYKKVKYNIQRGMLNNYMPEHPDVQSDDGLETSGDVSKSVIAPITQRNEVYNALLNALNLSSEHRSALKERGLTDEAIDRLGFKSLPKYIDPCIIPKKLMNAGYDLRGVPGFGINAKGEWSLAKMPDGGFLIPNRNGSAYIQGFQIRFDHPSDTIPKYGYFTSKKMQGGTKAGSWCCWAGEDLMFRLNNKVTDPFDVIIIEGPLKALIVHEVTKCNVISVPGVAALQNVPSALKAMIPLGLRKAYIAYDMDSKSNAQVAAQLRKLIGMLHDLKIPSTTMEWDPEYKGLDDWITSSLCADLRRLF